ncbi:NUDIX domain-containing protein [Maridesulfovibrio hydrothermalis]|uniref:NUDIX hydrolase n=1 Tax=Maridesulfovibrio hydrothermalis AM13 = DSM 14728 TaxID=1121451 RepID=L0RB10_9BACT|nr:NUDIX hydrolase [Maridesulfovibrio hydrothermalis]CCO23924.1 NUDIX hydrolase [Maridesulfovibrio hydrothermalis AM13 = DSM 14728]
MVLSKPCPHCGKDVVHYRNPVPTVDIVIYDPVRGVVLIERKNPPLGWALPGGFVDYGETLEHAAVREAKEETGLEVVLTGLVGVYSMPCRDDRQHTISITYSAVTGDPEKLIAGDDAGGAGFFKLDDLPELVFDHTDILKDFSSNVLRLQAHAAIGNSD